jgi:Protein of unknown function (DUF1571)
MCHGKPKFKTFFAASLLMLLAVSSVAAQSESAAEPVVEAANPAAEKLARAKQLLKASNSAFAGVRTYTATIICQDRIKGKTRQREYIFTKFRKPINVYLKWQPGPYEGMQCSYLPKRDGKDRFQALETGMRGMLGIMTWDHDSSIIDALYPHHFRTFQTSIKYLIELTNGIILRAEKMNKVEILEITEVIDPFIKRKATKITAKLSDKKSDNLLWPKVELYFDHRTKLPLHFKLYAFDGGLYGEYAFINFKSNVALTDADFEIVD